MQGGRRSQNTAGRIQSLPVPFSPQLLQGVGMHRLQGCQLLQLQLIKLGISDQAGILQNASGRFCLSLLQGGVRDQTQAVTGGGVAPELGPHRELGGETGGECITAQIQHQGFIGWPEAAVLQQLSPVPALGQPVTLHILNNQIHIGLKAAGPQAVDLPTRHVDGPEVVGVQGIQLSAHRQAVDGDRAARQLPAVAIQHHRP